MNVGLVTGPVDAERTARAADEGRLARAELARDRDDVADVEQGGERAAIASVSSGEDEVQLHAAAQKRPSWHGLDVGDGRRRRGPGLERSRRRHGRGGASRTRPSSAGMRAKSYSSTFSIAGV